MSTSAPIKRKPRRPGRPRASEPQGAQLKTGIIDAAARVYGEHGYSAATVELISSSAGVSRALFYRLFKDKHEVIDLVVKRANDQLRGAMLMTFSPDMDQLTLVKRMVQVYFEWCEAQGPVAASIYHELHRADSPAALHRKQIVAEITEVWRFISLEQGEKPLKPFLIESLIRAVEHAGSTAFCPAPKSPDQIRMYRLIAERIVLASIARPHETERVPDLDQLLD